jgi:pimeloyl-ACP methyl ester carboxylesterase
MNDQHTDTQAIRFAELDTWPYPLSIEYEWIHPERTHAPLAIFLHEGLGSIALWKGWPHTLCERMNCRGLVYSRAGYGRSTPRRADEKWPIEFLHRQAREVLPALLDALDIDEHERRRMVLIGHSDGGTIALLYACAYPESLAGAVVMAPHVFVEDITVKAILDVRAAYASGGLRNRLASYHDDVDSAFYGWNDAWLTPAFRDWDITGELASIRCPLLAIQGHNDEYASMLQIDKIKDAVSHAHLLKLDDCGHSPHRDVSGAVNEAIAAFLSFPRA